MPKLPRITARKAVKAFGKAGFEVVRITGSHQILRKEGHPHILTIPDHSGKDLGPGLLKSQIKVAGLTVEEFIRLLES